SCITCWPPGQRCDGAARVTSPPAAPASDKELHVTNRDPAFVEKGAKMQDNQAEYSQPEERQGQSSEGSELLQEGSPLSSPPPPTPASVLREGGVIMPQLDSLEAVLL